MSDVWYCVNGSDTGDWVTSIWDGLGIPAAQIPSTGTSGAAYLFNDIADQGASPTDEFSSVMLTVPMVGTFTHNEYSAFSFTGASDGVHVATYSAKRNGVPYLNPETVGGEWLITMVVGDGMTLSANALAESTATASLRTRIRMAAAATAEASATATLSTGSGGGGGESTESMLTMSIAGIPNGSYRVLLRSHPAGPVVLDENVTFAGGIATVSLTGVSTGQQVSGYVIDNANPATNGATIYGTST